MVLAPLALALFVLGIGANHHDAAFALDDFALFANGLNGRSDFHFQIPPCTFPKRNLFRTPCNASLGQVVRGHFNRDLITRQNADEIHS